MDADYTQIIADNFCSWFGWEQKTKKGEKVK
jgi:hypothetical protein